MLATGRHTPILGLRKQRNEIMSHKENPNIRFISVRVTQTLYLLAEKGAEAEGMDMSRFVRDLLSDRVSNMQLTSDDYEELARRTKDREKKIHAKKK